MADGRIVIDVDVDGESAKKNFKSTSDSIKSESDGIIKNFAKLEAFKFTAIGGGIGAITPQLLGLASAVVSAGSAFVAFGALAVTNLRAIFDEEAKLTAKQAEGRKALEEFQTFWAKFAGQFQTPVVDIFIKSLGVLQSVIEKLKPLFDGSVVAVQNLLNKFAQKLETPEVQKIIQWIGATGGPMLEKFGILAGNALLGVLNLLRRFAPVGETVVKYLNEFFAGFNKMSTTTKSFSTVLNTLLTSLVNLAVKGISVLLKKIQEFAPKLLIIGGNLLTSLIKGIIKLLPKLVTTITSLLTTIGTTLQKNFPQILTKGTQLVIQLINGIVKAIPKLVAGVLKLVVIIVQTLWNNRAQIVTSLFNVLMAMVNGISKIKEGVKSAIKNNVANPIRDKIKSVASDALSWGRNIIQNLISGIASKVGSVKSKVSDISSSIKSKMQGIASDAVGWGKNIIQGLINGFQAKVGALKSKVSSVVKSIKDKLTGLFDIHSPSRWAKKEIGFNLAKGIGIGMTDKRALNMDDVSKQLQSTLLNGFSVGSGSTTNNNQNMSRSLNVTVNNAGGRAMSISEQYRQIQLQSRILGAQIGLI